MRKEKQECELEHIKAEMEIEEQRRALAEQYVKTLQADTEYHRAKTQLALAKKRG